MEEKWTILSYLFKRPAMQLLQHWWRIYWIDLLSETIICRMTVIGIVQPNVGEDEGDSDKKGSVWMANISRQQNDDRYAVWLA